MTKKKNSPFVNVTNLTKTFDMKTYHVDALKNISFSVNPGEFIGLLGPSGCGKTTLINCMSGLLTPTTGSVTIDTVNITQLSQAQIRDFRLRNIGMVFQEHLLVESLSALENVALPLIFGKIPENERKEQATELLIQFGMENKIDHLPSELSGGEQQHVGIARSLAFGPILILADEPTGDLDTRTGQLIIRSFKEIANNGIKGVVMVSHDPRHRPYFDRVLEMSDGRLTNS
ncbi:MAG: ABC transporter ATP-binding protein [Candidatus Hodarchaeales archaeon]